MKNPALTVLLVLLLPLLSSAQDNPPTDTFPSRLNELCQMGEQDLLRGQFERAVRAYRIAIDQYPGFPPAYRGLAAAQELLGYFPEAAANLERAIQLNPYFSRAIYFDCAVANYRSGNYHKAKRYFMMYQDLLQRDIKEFGYNGNAEQEVEKEYIAQLPENLRACRMAMDSIRNLNVKAVTNLGDSINSWGDEYFPFLTNQQDLMFYTKRISLVGDENLYYSVYRDGRWTSGQPVDTTFNTLRNEGMCTMTRDGIRMFFTACGRSDVQGTCDIQEAKADSNRILWTQPLSGTPNTESWESQASISCDGSALFFASNRSGGYGGTDIWVSYRQADGSWGEAQNLGPRINTKLDEEAPFITNDAKTIYFSSTGHLGLGEQDIFMSRLQADEQWGYPINLGRPINTAYRELGFFLSADGRQGYFSSNRREGGSGGMDIYMFELSKEMESDPITLVEGFVRDSITRKPIQTLLRIKGENPIRTDENGRFFICLPANDPFKFHIFETGYQFYQRNLIIPEWDNKVLYPLELLLQPYRPKNKPEAPKLYRQKATSIYFAFDKDLLQTEAIEKLDSVAQFIHGLGNPGVEIVGFCDFIGSDKYNLLLSERRANAAALYLKQQGIKVDKITIEGKGEINDDNPRALNRRVDILYYGKQ
ncbi:MAG: OmpA family protein [Bacteroidota bacterium]